MNRLDFAECRLTAMQTWQKLYMEWQTVWNKPFEQPDQPLAVGEEMGLELSPEVEDENLYSQEWG